MAANLDLTVPAEWQPSGVRDDGDNKVATSWSIQVAANLKGVPAFTLEFPFRVT